MKYIPIIIVTLALLAGLFFLITYILFRIVFYNSRKKENHEAYRIPDGKIYEPYRDLMISWMKENRARPHEVVCITSFDGLRLCGKYYECKPGAPIELMFHGYRGTAERDMCGGVNRCFSLGRNALVVDQRASGFSEGNVISFGINERRDCRSWIDYTVRRFGPDVKIILTGISMGAATVMMAGGMDLPGNVIGILADCGYTSARDIIKKVIRQLKLPANLLYPLVRLSARLYGGFNLEETSPNEALKNCRVPVIFVHGESDDFVPCEMSRINYETCPTKKHLLTVPDAGHGLSFMLDSEKYFKALNDFSEILGLSATTE